VIEMMQTSALFVMGYMMTLTFHAAGSAESKDVQQPGVANMASTYVPLESWVSSLQLSGRSMTVNREFLRGRSLRDLRVTADIAVHPEWQLRVEEQPECRHFPLLSTTRQPNAAFTLQLSCQQLGRSIK
jgi:hypothetical protein